MVALIAVPILFALLGGFGGAQLGEMMLTGLRTLAPTGVMLMFAILYFGLMIDVGLFDPLIKAILRVVGDDPMKVVIGTALLAALVSLDGDGSTTYMITVAAMLPLYRRLRLDPLTLTCVTILASGVMNLTPWGGPLARAASALHVEPAEVFVPMLPAMVAGIVGVFGLAWLLGRREKQRLGRLSLSAAATAEVSMADSALMPPAVERRCAAPAEAACDQRATHAAVARGIGARRAAATGTVHGRVCGRAADQLSQGCRPARTHWRACQERDRGGLADLRRGHFHRHPERHRHARRDGEEHARPGAVRRSVLTLHRLLRWQACRSRSSSRTTRSISAWCRSLPRRPASSASLP